MGLTDRSRANAIEKKLERAKNARDKAEAKLEAKKAKAKSKNEYSDEKKAALAAAREAIDIAKELFEETGELEHSKYLQKCVSDYDNLQRRLK